TAPPIINKSTSGAAALTFDPARRGAEAPIMTRQIKPPMTADKLIGFFTLRSYNFQISEYEIRSELSVSPSSQRAAMNCCRSLKSSAAPRLDNASLYPTDRKAAPLFPL